MSPRRVTLLLVAGIVVIVLAVWLSSSPHSEQGSAAGEPVLPGLDRGTVNSVTEVRLSKADSTQTTLKKGAADWSVAERGYPADSGKVRKLLLELSALNVVEEKTRVPENYPALGVEDTHSSKATGTRVDVVTAGKTYSLIVGKSSGAKSGFVRVVSAPQSLLAAPSISVDADPKRWLDHALIDIPQDRIKEIAVAPAGGPAYTARRASKDPPDFAVTDIPKGRKLSSPAAADPIAGSLSSVSLDDVQHAPQTAPAGVSHAVFSTFDGLKIDVAGRKEGTRTLVSFTPTSTTKATEAEAKVLAARMQGWEFEIPSYKYDGMFRSLEDLLQKPEPPAKGGKGKAPGSKSKAALPGAASAPAGTTSKSPATSPAGADSAGPGK
jgi:Domain of unknown function (DUF4340)